MSQKILVTYASRGGSTQGVAHTIGAELVKLGADLDMRYLLDVKDLKPYDVIIVGAPIRMGHWLPEAHHFISIHQQLLQQKKLALFVVSMTMHEDTSANRQKVLDMLQPTLALVKPMDVGLFAGAVKPAKLTFFWRVLIKLMRVPEGDFRNYETIRNWAKALFQRFPT
jgi:menaquinone-dependent protoporphyrinogen oxidase